MKKMTWVANIKNAIFGTPTRRTRRKSSNGQLTFKSLETRNMLASVSFDAGAEFLTFQADAGEVDVVSVSSPTADTLQIQVAGGDEIALGGDAVGRYSSN